jgi:hypothetical protein
MNSAHKAELCTVGERTWFLEDSEQRRIRALLADEILLTAPDWHQPMRCDYLNTPYQVALCSISQIMKTACNVTSTNGIQITFTWQQC